MPLVLKEMARPALAEQPCPLDVARESFAAVQALSKQWYDKEREGIALIESFQTAVLACRDGSARPNVKSSSASVMDGFLHDNEAAKSMDPLLAESLFTQIKELSPAFTELLDEMCGHLATVKTQIHADDDQDSSHHMSLSVSDYAQFLAHELACFEAEYQHIEALLGMVSFSITVDQLRTLVISWSTSPFLEPDASKDFRQRHDQSLNRQP